MNLRGKADEISENFNKQIGNLKRELGNIKKELVRNEEYSI